jgi:hypothetical protein
MRCGLRWCRRRSSERAYKGKPRPFAKLEAEDRQADEREPKQLTLAEHTVLFAKLQGPKRVEATHQEGFICVGGFSKSAFLDASSFLI